MPQDSFHTECDRLSQIVDPVQFERLRWARTEAPMLARLVELAQAATDKREDFELTEEGSTKEVKRFVVKVHGFRVVALALGLDGLRAKVWVEPVERSRYQVAPGQAVLADFETVDEEWFAGALQQLFGRVQG